MGANVDGNSARKQHEYVEGFVWRSEGQDGVGQRGAGGCNPINGGEARCAEEEDLHIWARQKRKIGSPMRGLK